MLFAALLVLAACPSEAPTSGGFEVSPPILHLGRIPVGTVARQRLELKNTGAAVVRLLGARVTGDLVQELRIEGLPAALAAGRTHVAEVIAVPVAPGAQQGTIVIATDAGEARVEVLLHAIAHPLRISPSTIDFERVVVGQVSTSTVRVSNDSAASITLRAISPADGTSSEFSVAFGHVRVLGPNAALELAVSYAPDGRGIDEGRFTVADDSGYPVAASWRVRAEGLDHDLSAEPDTVSFGSVPVGRSARRAIQLQNLAAQTRRLTVWVFGSSEFEVVGASGPFDLEPAEERRVEIVVRPSEAGLRTASLVVQDEQNVLVVVPVSAIAEQSPEPRVLVEPRMLAFGLAQVGSTLSHTVRLRNAGHGSLEFTAAVTNGSAFSFARDPDDTADLEPGDDQTLTLTFAPRAVGSFEGDFQLSTNDPSAASIVLRLSGSATTSRVSELVIDPAVVEFGTVPRGAEATRTVRLLNSRTSSTEVTSVVSSLPELAVRGLSLPVVLPPGGALAFELGLLEPPLGPLTATLSVSSSDPDSPLASAVRGEVADRLGDPELVVQLLSDHPGADLELHMVRSAGAPYDRPHDACFCNPNPNWGDGANWVDDPLLIRDSIDGRSGERLVLWSPPADVYVLFATQRAGAPPALARLEVYSYGRLLGREERVVRPGFLFELGTIDWVSRTYYGSRAPTVVSNRTNCY